MYPRPSSDKGVVCGLEPGLRGIPAAVLGDRGVEEIYVPSTAVRRLACGRYGFGHTNHREPGDTRGTPIGKKGRFRDVRQERRWCPTLET